MKGICRLLAQEIALPDSQPKEWRPVEQQRPGMRLRQLEKLLLLG